MNRLRELLVFGLCLVGLHAVASLVFPPTAAAMAVALRLVSPDLLVLLGLAVFAAATGWARLGAHLAALLLLAAMAFRAAATMVPMLLERQFELADVGELPGLFHLLLHDQPEWLQVTKLVGIGLGAVATQWLLGWAFARLARAARGARGAIAWGVTLQLAVLAGLAQRSLDPRAGSLFGESSLAALGREAARTAWTAFDRDAVDVPIRRAIAAGAERMASAPRSLAGLRGCDVHLVFVESYGRLALRHESFRPHFEALWGELSAQLQAAGFLARSAACRPSIRGGASWLAHAELLTGVHVGERRTWELLLGSDLQALPRCFREAGYRTVEVMPAMDRHWPEGQRFYGYDDAVTQLELGYDGTLYHWGRMPDQFALHHLLERFVVPATQPLFTTFVSVTSHAPFTRIPPYVADWRIGPDTFRGPPRVDYAITWIDMLHNPQLLPAYRDAIDYSLRTVVGFTCRLSRPSVVVVLGDHQPPLGDALQPPDTSFDVPIHVFANRPELLAPLSALGFVEGLGVPDAVVAFPTAEFAPALLRAYAK